MKKQISNFGCRLFAGFLLSVFVMQSAVTPVVACGPSFLQPVFIFERRPDFPRKDYLSGNIGVINPTYTRSNLFIAYRYLSGSPLTAQEQDSVEYFWERRKRDSSVENDDPTQRAAVKWILTRTKVTSDLPPNYSSIDLKNYAYAFALETEKKYKGYVSYINCNDNALKVAAETLQNRIDAHGADNPNVKEWLKGQDIVFSNCSEGKNVPSEVSPDAPQWLKNDRQYQIAASFFYAPNYAEAKNRFQQIAGNRDSVWSDLADYLVGRTLVRQGNFEEKEAETKKYFEQAADHLQKVVAKNTKYRTDAQALLNFVKLRISPERRVRELNDSLLKNNPNNDLGQDLIDYIWLLDAFETKSFDALEEKTKTIEKSEPRSENTTVNSNTANANSGSNVVSNIVLTTNSNPTANANRDASNTANYAMDSNRSVSQLSTEKTPNSLTDDIYPSYQGELKLEQKDLPVVLLEDDLSDWIFNYQLSDEKALSHAVERWQKTRKEHWLMSVLSKVKSNHRNVEDFLLAAEKTSHTSKAFPTISFHQTRLLIEKGRIAEARTKLDYILSSTGLNLPLSAQNQFLRQRMYAAQNLDEFLKFATRRSPAFAWDDGTGYEDFSEKIKGEDYLAEERFWKDRLMFDEDAQQVFELQMPLEILKEVAKSPRLPDYLKRQFLIALWTRAVLLNRDAVAREAALMLARYAPETQAVINPYLSSATLESRRASALYALLKTPAFDPHFRSGMGRLTEVQKIDSYRDNWWCASHRNSYSETDQKPLEVPRISFLSDSQITAAKTERSLLESLGNAPPFLVNSVVEWANASPRDPRVPEALHLAVRATRYGCYTENMGKYSKAAFDLLHRRYPKSEWARETPYWFGY